MDLLSSTEIYGEGIERLMRWGCAYVCRDCRTSAVPLSRCIELNKRERFFAERGCSEVVSLTPVVSLQVTVHLFWM